MFLMYVDESGDCGLDNSPSSYFVLSGVVIHELRWKICFDQILNFRKTIKKRFNLNLHDEIHAANFISKPGDLVRIKRNDRLSILRLYANEISSMSYLNVINIVVNKTTKAPPYDVFDKAWTALIQRFENTITKKNFNGPSNPDELGIIIPDNTDQKKLTKLSRKMRIHNTVTNTGGIGYRNLPIKNLIEDPFFKDSADSYFIQTADLIAYLLYQYKCPNKYMKKNGGEKYFKKLDPILCKVASNSNPLGIVDL